MTLRHACLAALALLLATPAFCETADGQLAGACASCHRPEGGDTGIPPIVGLSETGIVQMMLAYRTDKNVSQIMHVVAAAMSPAEIASLAHYLAGRGAVAAQP